MNHAAYREAPVRDPTRLEALKVFRERGKFVWKRARRNSVPREFSRQ